MSAVKSVASFFASISDIEVYNKLQKMIRRRKKRTRRKEEGRYAAKKKNLKINRKRKENKCN
jgi:hypothetical protein